MFVIARVYGILFGLLRGRLGSQGILCIFVSLVFIISYFPFFGHVFICVIFLHIFALPIISTFIARDIKHNSHNYILICFIFIIAAVGVGCTLIDIYLTKKKY